MGRLLQILGCVLLLAPAGAAAGGSRADAEILAPIARAIQAVVAGTGAVSPAPSPTPTPKPKVVARSGGPLMFAISGSLSLGESSTASTYGKTGFFTPSPGPNGTPTPGPFPFQQASTTAQNPRSRRRLHRGCFPPYRIHQYRLEVPLRVSANGSSTLGVPQFLYSTPSIRSGTASSNCLRSGSSSWGRRCAVFRWSYRSVTAKRPSMKDRGLGPMRKPTCLKACSCSKLEATVCMRADSRTLWGRQPEG